MNILQKSNNWYEGYLSKTAQTVSFDQLENNYQVAHELIPQVQSIIDSIKDNRSLFALVMHQLRKIQPLRTDKQIEELKQFIEINQNNQDKQLTFPFEQQHKLMSTMEQEYMEAVKNGDIATARHMINNLSGIELKEYSLDRGTEHAPNGPFSGAPIYDLTENGIYDKDIYGFDGHRLYASGDPSDSQAFGIAMMCHNRPNMPITIYRSVPIEIKGGVNCIRPGDWVTTVRRYAVDHGESNLGGKGKFRICQKSVFARDIYNSGDSLLEFGYHPQQRFHSAIMKDKEGNVIPLSRRLLWKRNI